MTGIAHQIAKSWDTGQNLTASLCKLAEGSMSELCHPELKGKTVSEILESLKPDVLVSIYSISIIRSNIQASLIALNELLLNGSANSVLATGHDYRGTKRSNSSSEQSTENKSKCNDKCVHPHKLGHKIKIRAPV